jgi:hypothetical protein
MFRSFRLGAGLALAACLGAPAAGAGEGSDAPAPLELTPAQQTQVRQLAEQALQAKGLLQGKVFFTGLEVFVDSASPKPARHALVQHYRYDGDLTLQTSIDLDRQRVTKVEAMPHSPTSLAPEELERAERLARGHAEVKRALARAKGAVEVDALLIFTSVANAPTYNHRVVHLFFRQGRDYLLYGPIAEVDLTTETVRVDRSDTGHK